MKAPTASPAQPSRSNPVTWEITAEARTAAVEITSFVESTAVASRVSESIARPRRRLNVAIHSFTSIEATSTTTTAGPNSVGSGWTIFSTDDPSRLMPMAHTSTATTSPARYS